MKKPRAGTNLTKDAGGLWLIGVTVAAFAAGILAFLAFNSRRNAEREWIRGRDDFKKSLEYQKKYYELTAQLESGASIPKPDEVDRISSTLEAELNKQGIGFTGITPEKQQPRKGWLQSSFKIDTDPKKGPIPRNAFAGFLREVERARPWLKTRDIIIHQFTETGDIDRATVTFAYYRRKAD